MKDIKLRLQKIIHDSLVSPEEINLAKTSFERIEELENRQIYHWTEMARFALLTEVNNRVIGKQAATKIDSFLKRHRIRME